MLLAEAGGTYTFPRCPDGDAQAVRRTAAALRQCSAQVSLAQSQAHQVVADARGAWTGIRIVHPRLHELDIATHAVERAFREAADRLDDYARALDKAQHQHHWTWKKTLALGGVVLASGVVVVASGGIGTPGAAAVVGAEVAATTTAVSAATVAGLEAAEAVTLAVRALRLLRAASTFLRPQVKLTAGLVDLDAFVQLHSTGTLHPGHLASGAAINLATGAVPVATVLRPVHQMVPGVEGPLRRAMNLWPHAAMPDPNWGLTAKHLNKHLLGASTRSLRHVDPGGHLSTWMSYIEDLATMPATKRLAGGVEEVTGHFPRTDGTGSFVMGIRISRRPNGEFDLVTLLTRQS